VRAPQLDLCTGSKIVARQSDCSICNYMHSFELQTPRVYKLASRLGQTTLNGGCESRASTSGLQGAYIYMNNLQLKDFRKVCFLLQIQEEYEITWSWWRAGFTMYSCFEQGLSITLGHCEPGAHW